MIAERLTGERNIRRKGHGEEGYIYTEETEEHLDKRDIRGRRLVDLNNK